MPLSPEGRRAAAALKWAGLALVALVGIAVVVYAFADANALRGTLARVATLRLGRDVAIGRIVAVDRWSRAPRLVMADVTVANPPAEGETDMARIDRLEVRLALWPLLTGHLVFPVVNVHGARMHAHRDAAGHANWIFGSGARDGAATSRAEPPRLPVVRKLVLDDGHLDVDDDVRKLVFHGTVAASEDAGSAKREPFRLTGKGELNGRPFAATISGGSLLALKPGEPYLFDLDVHAAGTDISGRGVVPAFDLAKIRLRFEASGNDMADLYYLSGLAIPNTPPYEITATLDRDGTTIHLADLAGRFGDSDLQGTLEIDTGGERPRVKGTVHSATLVLKDLTAPLGARVDPDTAPAGTPTESLANDSGEEGASATEAAPPRRAFPDAALQVNRVRGMDADLNYSAARVDAGTVPLEDVAVHLALDDGVLAIDPFAVALPQGKITGSVHIDARGEVPQTVLDLRVNDVELEQFKGTSPSSTPPVAGLLQAHAQMHGSGASVHDFVGHAQGTVTAIVPHGEIRAALAELTGIDVLRGLGLLLKNDQQRAEVRCGLANFEISDGVMRAEHVVLDTADVLITGSGELRLGPEELDLALKGHPKKARFVRLDAPIELDGHLRDPGLHVGVAEAARQVGIAAVLSAVVAPIAALFAFVDRGLADDENCAALLAESPLDAQR